MHSYTSKTTVTIAAVQRTSRKSLRLTDVLKGGSFQWYSLQMGDTKVGKNVDAL